jgi:toxin ParE1/3/4
MKGRFDLRPQALSDIAEIVDYIATENLGAADRFLATAYQAFGELARRPLIGSARRFRRESLRNIRLWRLPYFEKYLVIYMPTEKGVEIIRVLHGARDIERLLNP